LNFINFSKKLNLINFLEHFLFDQISNLSISKSEKNRKFENLTKTTSKPRKPRKRKTKKLEKHRNSKKKGKLGENWSNSLLGRHNNTARTCKAYSRMHARDGGGRVRWLFARRARGAPADHPSPHHDCRRPSSHRAAVDPGGGPRADFVRQTLYTDQVSPS
jgi:hypothetical protein